MIDDFPQRMDRFLECISRVYIDTHDPSFAGGAVGKKLVRQYQTETTSKKMHQE